MQRARMDVAGADRDRRRQPDDVNGTRRADVDVTISQLAVVIVAPTLDVAVGEFDKSKRMVPVPLTLKLSIAITPATALFVMGEVVAGIALGLLFNPVTGPETRKWVKDMIGGGDEFGGDYSPNGGGGSSPS